METARDREASILATVWDNSWIPHKPWPKQLKFLEIFDREVLYGGAGGGGKSDALLMAAVQFVEVPDYHALLLRKTYADLALPGAIMHRSHDWWGGNAHWNSQEKKWTFPSGAVIQFGYLENVGDEDRYRSADFQFIGWDELTQFEEGQYLFLFTRLRKLTGSQIPLRVRGATNPGGKGHSWVRKRFIPPEYLTENEDTRFEKIWSIGRRQFVPARVEDNPALDLASYDESLKETYQITYAQIRHGDWKDWSGGRFKPEWFRYFNRHGTGFELGGTIYTIDQIRNYFLTVDTATSVKKALKDDPDYTVISAWGMAPAGELLWLGCTAFRAEMPDVPPRVYEQYQRWGAGKAYVEGGGPQKGFVQLMRRHGPLERRMNVVEILPKGDKLQRAANIMNIAEAGRLWLPTHDPLFPLDEVLTQLIQFTGDEKQDAHDDIVDTASMAGDVASGKAEGGKRVFRPYLVDR